MKVAYLNIATITRKPVLLALTVLLCLLSVKGYSQNTKGDRPPVKNQRQVKETKVKSYKRKEKGRTKDIAGRRLRTKGQSSANRANASYPQPSPYSRQKTRQPERAAKPLGRVFTKSPKESRTRAWKGDVSGYSIRRVKPSRTEAARNNVYPQKGPYVRYARKQPEKKPLVYSKTIKGKSFVRHKPRTEERAWKGSADHGPIRNQSATGTIRNTYSQKGQYVSSYKKRPKSKEKSVSNSKEVSRVKRLSNAPRTEGGLSTGSPSATRPYIQRGKKNVYWGKYQKKEKGVTTDITGGPLRTRNYKSATPGLVGRDSLRFFGKRPSEGKSARASAGGYATATGKGQRGWRGDIAGWNIRKSRGQKETVGKFVFPRKLSVSRKMRRGTVQGGGYSTRTKRGEQAQLSSVPNIVYARDLGSKKMKGIKSQKGGGSIAAGWNNKGQPVRGRGPGVGSAGAARYSGSFRSGRGYSQSGTGYSGNIRRGSQRGFSRDGIGYSGNMKRGTRGYSLSGAGYSGNIRGKRGFSEQGIGYSGNIKGRRGFSEQGAGYSGNIRGRRGFSEQGIGYSGNIKGRRGFSEQGAGYSGTIKRGRIEKGGGSVSGNLWNNNNRSVSQSAITPEGARAARYSGNNKSGPIGFGKNGVDYSGFVKRSSIRGYNREGEGYAGNIKFRRQAKGGGSVSGHLINNNFQPIPVTVPKSADAGAIRYAGRVPRRQYVQNPNAFKESLKKLQPTSSTYQVSGLQVPVKQHKYERNPNAHKLAMPGIAPRGATVKASEYSRSMKRYWTYKHNPNSNKYALKGIAPSKASGKISDYQGNMKMHKYSGSRLHPDAQFAHGYRDNVKGERTVIMNVKLIWGKLFRKNETQPSNLKEKGQKPKYDKREKDLWND